MKSTRRSATRSGKSRFDIRHQLRSYAIRHMQAALFSLGRQSRSLLANLMTVAVIGIALALPAALYMGLNHVGSVSRNLNSSGAALSVFLRPETGLEQANSLKKQLTDWPEVSSVSLIEKRQALAEFEEYSGFGRALEALEENPLPHLLIVQPAEHLDQPGTIHQLQQRLDALAEVEITQVDLAWLQRFQAMTLIGQRSVLILGILLSLAVLLVIGNTIRLEVYSRRPEIEIMKLVGATDAFIRRPFLYTGFWYGLFGGLFACSLLILAVFLLQAPIQQLSVAYNAIALDTYPDLALLGLMLLTSCLLGLAGAWLSVSRHLIAIEPA